MSGLMHFRPAILALFTVLVIVPGTSCQKSESRPPGAPSTILSPDTIVSVHWLGKKRLGITFGAYYLMRIWVQPQSAQLERQTILKLACAPGLWLPGGTNLSVDAESRLLLLLNDMVQEESYLEIRDATNSQPSLVFAIQLNEAQTGQWLTNLAAVLEPLTGARAVANPDRHGWSLESTNILNLIQVARVGDWTLVGVAAAKNPLLAEISARIRRDGVPFVSSGTNLWLEADLAPSRLVSSLPTRPTGGEGRGEVGRHEAQKSDAGRGEAGFFSTLNRFDFSLSGDGANVITRTKVTFNNPFSTTLEPWQLPLPLLHEPLTSLTVVRGVQPRLANWPAWRDLQIGAPPDQLFFWSLAGSPYQLYLAAPLPAAGVSALTDHLLQKGNPWLAANGYISFDRASDANGITWGNLPDIKPFIKSAGDDSQGWLYAGLLPDTNTAAIPPPAGLIQDIQRRTNLVYYDWEVTGPRLQPCLQLAQTIRIITRQRQLLLDSASLNWLSSLIPRLGTSATIINRTGPAELTLYRRSTLGLTAPEINLLTGWLESPQFPCSLHAFSAPTDK
jgi:hypothetical protein